MLKKNNQKQSLAKKAMKMENQLWLQSKTIKKRWGQKAKKSDDVKNDKKAMTSKSVKSKRNDVK